MKHIDINEASRYQIWRSAVLIAIPFALQVLLQSLLGMADILMVGTLGTLAIAAVGLAAKLHFLLLIIMSGISTASSVLIAQYIGAKKRQECLDTFVVSLLVGIVLMIPLAFAFGFGGATWVAWINPDPEVVALTAGYLSVTAPVLILTLIVVVFEGALRAQGNANVPLIFSAISAAINVALNYIFIFGHFGFPAMGVLGAAWATLLARFLHLVLLLLWVYLSKNTFAIKWRNFVHAFDANKFSGFVLFALPLVLNYAFWGLGNTLYHILAGFAGTEVLSVLGVMAPFEIGFLSLFAGIANASAVMIGQALGADKHDYAWYLHKLFDRITLVLVALLSVSLWLSMDFLIEAMGDFEEQLYESISTAFMVSCSLMWLRSVNMVRIVGVLRAGGDNTFCLICDTTVMWLIGLPIFFLVIWFTQLPLVFVYALLFLEELVKFVPVYLRIGKKYWMQNLAR